MQISSKLVRVYNTDDLSENANQVQQFYDGGVIYVKGLNSSNQRTKFSRKKSRNSLVSRIHTLVDDYKLCRYNKFHIHTEDILVLKLMIWGDNKHIQLNTVWRKVQIVR